MNYYAFHIGDYKAHTSHLSLIEDLAFRRMLDLYYLTESPLPEIKKIARAICMRENIEDIQNVLDEFFIDTEEGYIHNRCEREIKAMNDKSGKAKLSAQKRWSKTDNANAMPESCEGNANASNNHANASKTDANAMPELCEGNAPNPNPNINKKNNAQESFEESAQVEKLKQGQFAKPDTFKMTFDWKPTANFETRCKVAGKDYSKFTDDILLSFINYNESREQYKTQKEWEGLLLTAFMRELARPSPKQQSPYQQKSQPPQEYPNLPTAKYDMSNEIVLEKMPVVSKEEKERQRAIIKKMLEGGE